MTEKAILPQPADFVQGQQLTEAGFNFLGKISEKVDLLENASSEEITNSISELQTSLDDFKAAQPKVEIITSGEQIIFPIEDGYDYYEASVVVSVPFDNGDTNILQIVNFLGHGIPASTPDTEPYVKSLFVSAHREDLEYFSNGAFEFKYFADGVDTPTNPIRWVIKKYKNGA